MKRKNIRVLLLVYLLLCALTTQAFAAGNMYTLPAALQTIGEEAFMDTTAVNAVQVREGTKEISSRAFAGSTAQQILLPRSVTSIADDALEDCENVTVLVYRNSYAHQWAILNDVQYQILEGETVGDVYSVSGVAIVSETDEETGAEQLYLGATVTATQDCRLSLKLYDETAKTYKQDSGLAVSAPVSDAFLKTPLIVQTPEYYILEAVLIDEDGNELCTPCRNMTGSQAYAELQAKTMEDYPEESVVDFGSAGFGVLAEGVVRLNADAVCDGSSYTFSAAQSVQRGDMILLNVSGVPEVIKVGSVRQNSDGSLTVVRDDNVYLSEMYDTVKVGGNFVRSTAPMAGFTDDPDHIFSLDHTISLGPLEIGSHMEMNAHLEFTYDKHILDDYNLEITVDASGRIQGFLGGEIDTWKDDMYNGGKSPRIPIISEIVVLPGINLPAYLSVSIPINIRAKAGGSFEFGYQNTYGYILSQENGFSSYKKEGDRDAEVKLTGAVEIAMGPEVSLTSTLFNVLTAKIGAQFGPKIAGEVLMPSYGGTTADKVHACGACLDFDLFATANVRTTVIYKISEWIQGSLLDINLFAYEKKLCDGFFSISNEEASIYGGKPQGGWDECKNYKYRTTVNTVDMYGNAANNIPVTISGGKMDDVTGNSPLKTYLYNGSYTAKANFAAVEASEEVVIQDKAQQVTVYEPGIDICGYVTDYTTGDPIAGATVIIVAPGNRTVTVTTDSTGYYLAEGLPYGTHYFSFSADKYESIENESIVFGTGAAGRVDQPLVPGETGSIGEPFGSTCATVSTEEIEMSGKTYTDAIIYQMGYTGRGDTGYIAETVFNFKGKYGSISFDAGYYGGWERDAKMSVYADGTLVKEVEMKYTDSASRYTVSLAGVHQLRIHFFSDGYDKTRYALGDFSISPASVAADAARISDENFDSFRYTERQAECKTDSFTMGGNNYRGGYILNMGYGFSTSANANVGFEFNGEYSTLSFDVGKIFKRLPEAYLTSSYLTIEVDGVVLSGYDKRELKWNDLVLPVKVNVAGADQVLIKLSNSSYDRMYWAIGNIHIT